MAKSNKTVTTETETTGAVTTETETTGAVTTETEKTGTATADTKANWPTIFIPKKNKEDKQRLISVNLKKYMVQTGKYVQVPPEVAEVYNNSVKAEEERDLYEEEQQ